jgi:hypothetical protein
MQAPWRQQGTPGPPRQPLMGAPQMAAFVFPTSARYLESALLPMVADGQFAAPGRQKFPSGTAMQSESVWHDWS